MDEVEELQEELRRITVIPPDTLRSLDIVHESSYPSSYKENNEKEKNMLSFCENFQRQYSYLYHDRKILLLTAKNECGIEKFICTTIRPTLTKYPELYDYHGCASFIADYLTFDPLDSPIDLPLVLPSPSTILKRQHGNCFDFSILLCSLLIGSGYDAYCVSGYASKEVTLMDQSRELCPFLKERDETVTIEDSAPVKKYTVKPPKDLKSQFEETMKAKRLALEKEEEMKRIMEENQRRSELEKLPEDKLRGLRVHCWVLVLSGKREVPECFFIETLTGVPKALDSVEYLGIEHIWNHRNVWVNMQDCSQGVKNVNYNLRDPMKWEFMFPNTDASLICIPPANDDLLEIDDEEECVEDEAINIPKSWVSKIEISKKDFETRCPFGKKTVLFQKAKLEKFCEYLNSDGLVTRISIANDAELKDVIEVQEYYKHRADKLESRVHNIQTGWIHEKFAPGRSHGLKEHSYQGDGQRTMTFYSNVRVDGLQSRCENEREMTERFKDQENLLLLRKAVYGDRVKKFGPQGDTLKPLEKMVEHFGRDCGKRADDDIDERTFLLTENRILLKFHLQDSHITAARREFIKPANFTLEKSSEVQMNEDMTTSFQVDPNIKPMKELQVYNMMVQMLKDEKECQNRIRESEKECREILSERLKEEVNCKLVVSVYDTERNEKAQRRRNDLENQQNEEACKKREMELDYLAPFLARIGQPAKLTRANALKVREDCLFDLKQRLIDKANIIQARFEKETTDLQQKQAWYKENQMAMTKADEEEYLNFCSEAMFRIHILELRLNRHKEISPQLYTQLDEKLKRDARLADFMN